MRNNSAADRGPTTQCKHKQSTKVGPNRSMRVEMDTRRITNRTILFGTPVDLGLHTYRQPRQPITSMGHHNCARAHQSQKSRNHKCTEERNAADRHLHRQGQGVVISKFFGIVNFDFGSPALLHVRPLGRLNIQTTKLWRSCASDVQNFYEKRRYKRTSEAEW